VDDATSKQMVVDVLASDVNAPKVRNEILPQHIKKLAMVVHKDVAKTHGETNAHDVATVAIPIKEKAKGMVTYFSTPILPQGTWRSMNKLTFKLDLKKVLELPNGTFKPPKGKATRRPLTPLVGTSKDKKHHVVSLHPRNDFVSWWSHFIFKKSNLMEMFIFKTPGFIF
jgi:hypothetical protein